MVKVSSRNYSEKKMCRTKRSLQLSLAALVTCAGLVASLPSFLTPLAGRSFDDSDTVSIESRSTGGKVANKALARFDNSNIEDGMGNGTDWYHLYLGNGTEAAGWPSKDKWASFEDM